MSVHFTGNGQEYTRGINLGSLSRFTVAGWFRIDTKRSSYSTFWSIDEDSTSDPAWIFQSDNTGNSMVAYQIGGATTADFTMTVGTWYYYALSVNGSSWNARRKTAGSTSFTPDSGSGAVAVNATTLRLGNSPFENEWINGNIAGFKFWTTNLSTTELEAEAAQFAPVRTSNLYSYHRFVGPSTQDNSGLGHTLSGGTGTSQGGDPTGVADSGGTIIHGWGPLPAF
jgi:hypothetical protein